MSAVVAAPGRDVPVVGSPSFGATLTGTGRMVRFILRRDRVRIFWWTFGIVLFYAYFMVALDTLGQEALIGRAALMETPSGIVMGGPGYGLEDYTPERAVANEGITWWVIALGIMSILHVVRHTRTEEESSRSEIVRANAVGRHAPAVAAVLTLALVNLVIAVFSTAVILAIGGEYVTVADTAGLTLGVALSAMVFGAVALVAAQITVHSRGAIGMSIAVLGLTFATRAAGDMRELGGSALSWTSPFGWAQQMRPFVDLRWWPALLALAAIAILLVVGSFLGSRRDFGGGLAAERAGRPGAPAGLTGPLAMAWRQQRTALFWCVVGLGLTWYATGTLLPDIGEYMGEAMESNPAVAAMFGADPEDFVPGFLGIMLLFAMLCVAAYAIVMGGRARSEEGAGRAEVVLARPVARQRWFAAQLLVAALGTVVVAAASVYAMWAGAVSVGHEDQTFGDYTEVLWPYIPALLCYLGLTAALYAWLPRSTGLGWALLAYSFVIGFLGALVEDLPEEANYVNPLHWLPEPFLESPDGAHMAGLAVAAAALFALAFVGFRRRDVPAV